jgi:hypothetical protein
MAHAKAVHFHWGGAVVAHGVLMAVDDRLARGEHP